MTPLERLYADHSKVVYRYLLSLCRDASLSEDLTSEVFLEVVKSLAGYRGESDVKTWLFSIARRRWFKYLKKKKRTIETEALENLIEKKPPGFRSAEERYLDRELVRRVYEIIGEERETAKNVALMRIDGYSFYEIGSALGISESSARVMFFRTKEKLRAKLKEEFDYE